MDFLLGSTGFGPLLFLVGSLAVASPLAVLSASWRRRPTLPPPPPPPTGADGVDVAAAAAAAANRTDAAACGVCLEGLTGAGPLAAAAGVAATDGYLIGGGGSGGGGVGGGGRNGGTVAASVGWLTLCCGHVCHGGCIARWAALCPTTPACPVCQTPMGAPLWEVVFIK